MDAHDQRKMKTPALKNKRVLTLLDKPQDSPCSKHAGLDAVHQIQREINNRLHHENDTGHVQHHAAADAHAALPLDTGPLQKFSITRIKLSFACLR